AEFFQAPYHPRARPLNATDTDLATNTRRRPDRVLRWIAWTLATAICGWYCRDCHRTGKVPAMLHLHGCPRLKLSAREALRSDSVGVCKSHRRFSFFAFQCGLFAASAKSALSDARKAFVFAALKRACPRTR